MTIPKYSIKRSLSGKPSTNGMHSVLLRVACQGRRIEIYTGITLFPKQWKSDKVKQGCIINGLEYNVVNDLLRKQEEFIANYFNTCAMRDDIINLNDLKKQFNYTYKSNANTQSNEFFYVLSQYIENQSVTRSWKAVYKQEWTRVMNSVRNYSVSANWGSFTETFMNGYLNYLSTTLLNDKIKKYLRKLSEFLKWAKHKRYPVNDDFFV